MNKDAYVTFYRNRNAEFIPLFNQALELVYCSDINEVLLILGVDEYDSKSCRLFIDSSKLASNTLFFTTLTNMLPYQFDI